VPRARGIHVKAHDLALGVDPPGLRVVGTGEIDRDEIPVFGAQETMQSGGVPIVSDNFILRINVPAIRQGAARYIKRYECAATWSCSLPKNDASALSSSTRPCGRPSSWPRLPKNPGSSGRGSAAHCLSRHTGP
jgi:hypothetical protein